MKGKIAIVLFSLALVFGMVAASCDNGDFPAQDATKDVKTLVAYDYRADKDGNVPGPAKLGSLAKIEGQALYDLLYTAGKVTFNIGTNSYEYANRTSKTTVSGTTSTTVWYQKYVLSVVGAVEPVKDSDSDEIKDLKRKYALQQVVIDNPALK